MAIPKETMLSMYRTMLTIRKFETKAAELFAAAQIPGFVHLYIGEEAVASAVCENLNDSDYITSTHRGHGHLIAKGGKIDLMMAELMGRIDGYCKGKGGSMHIADVDLGILGANGIVGAGQPIAMGAAFACKYLNNDSVAVCFFGDGASNRGTFHEALNFATVHKLPLVFICENNQYGISCHQSNSMNIIDVSDRAGGYGIPGVTVDGNDVTAVYEAAEAAIARARAGEGPSLIEGKTWRHRGHFEGDPALYKEGKMQQEWLAKDPIPRAKKQLLDSGQATAAELDAMDNELEAAVEKAVTFAQNSPFPGVETMLDDVYA